MKLTLLAVVAGVLCGWAVLRAAGALQSDRFFAMWLFLVIISCTIFLPLAFEAARGEFDWFNLKNVFVAYILMQFVVWPLSAYSGVYDQEPTYAFRILFLDDLYPQFLKAEFVVLLGLLAFYAGYYLLGQQRAAPPTVSPMSWNPARLVLAAWFLAGISVLGFLILVHKERGLIYFISHIDEYRNNDLLGNGYLMSTLALARIASLAVLCLYYETAEYRSTAFALTLIALAVSLLGASRHIAVETVVGCVLARNYLGKALRMGWRTVGGVSALWLLNVAYVYYRRFGVNTAYELGQVTFSRIAYLIVPRFTGGESLARVVDVTDHGGFHGAHFILRDLLTSWVPRVMWPAKPLSAGLVENVIFFPDAFVGKETGAAVPTLYGELYWMAGIVGVIVGMLLLGIFFRRAYALTKRKSKDAIGLYALIFMFAFFVNETLSLHLFRFGFQLAVWFLLMRVVRTRALPVKISAASAGPQAGLLPHRLAPLQGLPQ